MIEVGHFYRWQARAGHQRPQPGHQCSPWTARSGARWHWHRRTSCAQRSKTPRLPSPPGPPPIRSAARAFTHEIPRSRPRRNMTKLAETLAPRARQDDRSPDAKGDIQRGLEVVEVCLGAPHMLKGEYTDGAGPRIDVYSMRPAARRRRRHHAVQFPGHDPAVEDRPGARRRQRLHH